MGMSAVRPRTVAPGGPGKVFVADRIHRSFSEKTGSVRVFREELRMDDIKDYFVCDSCENKDFRLVYNFSLQFHGVNFSDDLMYDRLTEEKYECTECKKAYTRQQIEEALGELKRRRKRP